MDTPPTLPSSSSSAPAAPKTSKLAIASLVCALLPIVPISTIAALICSAKAKKKIRESNGALKGAGLATSGMVISLVVGGGIFIIGVLAALATPAILKQRKKAEMIRTVSNSKQIYLCMLDFESDMGSFPDDITANELPDPALYSGTSSNRYLAQLIARGYCPDETIFTTGVPGYTKADNRISPPTEALKKGENGWSYVLVDDKIKEPVIRGLSTSDAGDIPVLLAPLADTSGKIDPKPFEARCVYIRIDGSARNESFMSGTKTPLDSSSFDSNFRPVVKMPE